MTSFTDQDLLADAHRLDGKVLVITGAANGIGRETALLFSKYKAKVVIGDIDIAGANHVVNLISGAGGHAVASKCDVTSWEDQVALFDLAKERYGSVDIVVANAGIEEAGEFNKLAFVDGRPAPPNMQTLNINLIGTLYSCHLGLYHLKHKSKLKAASPQNDRLKAIVLLGSMASWQAPGTNVMYGASKHAVLGIMRSLNPTCNASGIRIGIVHPWFADTPMLTAGARVMLAGLPLAPLPRIAATILRVATDPDQKTSGCPWILPDGGEVLRLDKELLKEGVYRILGERLRVTMKALKGMRYAGRIIRDLMGLLVPALTVMGGLVIAWAWAAPYIATARLRL